MKYVDASSDYHDISNIHNQDKITFEAEHIYRSNSDIFNELDYGLDRYGIKYCIGIIKPYGPLKISRIDYKNLIRLSDKHIPIDENYSCVLFVHTDIDQAYKAACVLEKKLIIKFQMDTPFKCALTEKHANCTSKEKFLQACRLIKEKTDEHIIFSHE